MSEIIAMEQPIVAANTAAREKLAKEYLEGREVVTVPELMDHLQCSRYQASSVLRNLGWTGTKGQSNWYPPGTERPAPLRTGKPGKSSRGRPSTVQKRKAMLKKLNAYLADKDAATTAEIQVHLECGKDMAKSLLREAGWNAGWGANAKWTPGEDKLAHRRRIVPSPSQMEKLMEETKFSRTLRAVEADEVRLEQAQEDTVEAAVERHPAGTDIHAPIVVTPDTGWRAIPDIERVKMKSVTEIMQDLELYGLEVRIQIREKRQ